LIALLTLTSIALYTLNFDSVESVDEQSFDIWMLKYSKKYAGKSEEAYRLTVWLQNLAYVQTHNKRYNAGE